MMLVSRIRFKYCFADIVDKSLHAIVCYDSIIFNIMLSFY